MPRIHLIRHGITKGNKKRWYYGKADLPILPEGFEEIEAHKKDGVYPEPGEATKFVTSGLLRTRQTLEAIYGERQSKAIPDLMEWDCGEFECKSYDELKDDYADWFASDSLDKKIPGGESKREFYTRVMRGYEAIPKDSDCVAVIHGAVIGYIMSRLFGENVENPNLWPWIPKPGRGYTITIEDAKAIDYKII